MRFQTDDIISQLRTVLSRTGLALEKQSKIDEEIKLGHGLPKRKEDRNLIIPTLMLGDMPILPSALIKGQDAEVVYQLLRENGFADYRFDEECWQGTIENCLIAQRYWLFVEECIKSGNLKALDKFFRHKAKTMKHCLVI